MHRRRTNVSSLCLQRDAAAQAHKANDCVTQFPAQCHRISREERSAMPLRSLATPERPRDAFRAKLPPPFHRTKFLELILFSRRTKRAVILSEAKNLT